MFAAVSLLLVPLVTSLPSPIPLLPSLPNLIPFGSVLQMAEEGMEGMEAAAMAGGAADAGMAMMGEIF